MEIQGPTPEDLKKLHTEVNQLVNQRLTITTLAVTVFAAVIAWLIPKNPPTPGSELGVFVFMVSILLTFVLLALFVLTHLLSQMLRIFTTYLDLTGASSWERDWSLYRERFSYMGYTRPQAIIFLLLGVISSGFPFLLWAAYPVELEPRAGAISCFLVGCVYIILVACMGLARWGVKEGEIRRRWKELQGS